MTAGTSSVARAAAVRSHGGAARPVRTQPPPATDYVPQRGDVVSIKLSPTGRAKTGRRPAVVLSPMHLNMDGSAVLCLITNRVKARFQVATPKGLQVPGVIVVDHLKPLDWRQRNAELIARLPKETVATIMRKLDIRIRHRARAEKLYDLRNSGVAAAEAWRTVTPNATKNDRSAAEQARRELRWYKGVLDEMLGKRCIGVTGRRCEKRVPSARHKFCTDCGPEQLRLQRQGSNRDYYRNNREELLEEARQRRLEAIRRAVVEERAAREREEALKRAFAPPTMRSRDGRVEARLNLQTQKWEYEEWYLRSIGRL